MPLWTAGIAFFHQVLRPAKCFCPCRRVLEGAGDPLGRKNISWLASAQTEDASQHRLPRSARDQLGKGDLLNLHLGLTPLIALIAGILILVMPKLLNYIVAAYLIVIGLVGLFGAGTLHLN